MEEHSYTNYFVDESSCGDMPTTTKRLVRCNGKIDDNCKCPINKPAVMYLKGEKRVIYMSEPDFDTIKIGEAEIINNSNITVNNVSLLMGYKTFVIPGTNKNVGNDGTETYEMFIPSNLAEIIEEEDAEISPNYNVYIGIMTNERLTAQNMPYVKITGNTGYLTCSRKSIDFAGNYLIIKVDPTSGSGMTVSQFLENIDGMPPGAMNISLTLTSDSGESLPLT